MHLSRSSKKTTTQNCLLLINFGFPPSNMNITVHIRPAILTIHMANINKVIQK